MTRRCEICGREIPQKRLDAIPSATLCAPCKQATDEPLVTVADWMVQGALAESEEFGVEALRR